MSDNKGYYKFLNLPPGSSIDEVRAAYMRMQRECNIDNPKVKQQLKAITNEAERKAKEKELQNKAAKLNEIKCVLMDEKEKDKYDKGMEFDFNIDGSSIFDLFGNFGGSFNRRQRKVNDTVTTINVTPREIYLGTTKKYKIKRRIICQTCGGKGGMNVTQCTSCRGTGKIMRQSTRGGFRVIEETVCPACHGEKEIVKGSKCSKCTGNKYLTNEEMISVDIPRGAKEGTKFLFKGKGDEQDGCITGNLVFVVHMTDKNSQSTLNRIGNDIIDTVEVDIFTVLAGGFVNYTHLDGEILKIKIEKKKLFEKECIVVHGKGFVSKEGVGSLYLKPKIKVNQNIDSEKLKTVLPPLMNVKEGNVYSASYDFIPEERVDEEEGGEEDLREKVFRSFGFF
ncbi:Mitochondrial protein import protein mas5 [Dictyocoela muelleri]|nr:Mitochondrial protein import protein mas5 [Dictyocoela muelleri]